jgi:hypothetical protein
MQSSDSNMDTNEPLAAVQARLRGPVFEALEDWRRRQPKIVPRALAMRLLLERALGMQQEDAA